MNEPNPQHNIHDFPNLHIISSSYSSKKKIINQLFDKLIINQLSMLMWLVLIGTVGVFAVVLPFVGVLLVGLGFGGDRFL